MSDIEETSPAKKESRRALDEVYQSIEQGLSFKLEAGAGAGKTYSLVEALRFLTEREGKRLRQFNQLIACITFTNVAKDEIEARTDRNPLIYCDTIHGFCWSVISRFQNQLRAFLPEIDSWTNRLEEASGTGTRKVDYSLGYRGITDDTISIHHDDVLALKAKLLEYEKFRLLLKRQYPIILIDEYQDTDSGWVEAVKENFLGREDKPLFGFFGDHWQKIYGNGCGALNHPSVREISMGANFRSVPAIVGCLNRMRPDLPQFADNPECPGEVRVFHTNDWKGSRMTGQHNGGDLPPQTANAALKKAMENLTGSGWDLSTEKTKILMLTHRALAAQQGYGRLPSVFRNNNAFTNKEHPHIAFFIDQLEPACRAFVEKRYGEMFEVLVSNKKYIFMVADKHEWAESMKRILEFRDKGTVGKVVDHLRETKLPQLPDSVKRLEKELENFNPEDQEEIPRALEELREFRSVNYKEIISLASYLEGHSPFETKHGVKGAEFENVLVVLGRGWNRYNFGKMLELAEKSPVPVTDKEMFERNRNLFYVVCSRPKKRLALLFTQKISGAAMKTLETWFGAENIRAMNL